MTKRGTFHGDVIRVGRLIPGQPTRYTEHRLDNTSTESWMRLLVELSDARHERERDAAGRFRGTVHIWEATREQADRIIAVGEAAKRLRAQKRWPEEVPRIAPRKAAYEHKRRPS